MSAILSDPRFHLRPMRLDDLPYVMPVEQAAYSHPWTEGIFRDCLRVGYQCWVAERGDVLVGHAVMSVAVGEAHILNLCIAPDRQGQGLGRRLLQRMLRLAAELQADTVYLEVRETNRIARVLYESLGFTQIGQRPDYYPDDEGRENALIYAKSL
jgi:ribosomal-protein-alanine N-acetyltransferase